MKKMLLEKLMIRSLFIKGKGKKQGVSHYIERLSNELMMFFERILYIMLKKLIILN
jgi:hypothetical protein